MRHRTHTAIIASLLFSFFSLAQGRFNISELKHIENLNSNSVCASPDGSYLVTESFNSVTGVYQAMIWTNTPNGYVPGAGIPGSQTKESGRMGFIVSPNGTYILDKIKDDMVYVYKKTGAAFKKITSLTDIEDRPDYYSFSADHQYLALGSRDEEVLYKITGDQFVKVNKHSIGRFTRTLFHPTDPHLCFYRDSIFTFQEGKLSNPTPLSRDDYFDGFDELSFSPDGQYICALGEISSDKYVFMFKKQTESGYRQVWQKKDPPVEESDFITFTPDSRYVALFDERRAKKKQLSVFKLESDSLVEEMSCGQYDNDLENFCFLNNGKYAVAEHFSEIIIYSVSGVKGTATTTNPVVTNNPVVKNDPVKPPVTGPTNPTVINNITNIFWISPSPENLDDKPVVSENPTIEIQIKVVSNKKVTKEDIRIIINGKEQGSNKFNEVSLQENKQDELFEYTYANAVPLEETADHINTIDVFVNGKKSNKPLKVLYSVGKPNLHVLAIGTALDLQFPQKDAKDFADLFKDQGGSEKDRLFGSVEIKTLTGKDATTAAIKECIEKFRYDFKTGAIGPRDVLLVFISSHGFIYQDQLRIQGDDFKEIYKETYSVAYNEITSRLKEVNCKKLIFLDACFSGGAKASVVDINNAIKDLNQQGEGVTTFSSSSNDEYSYEDVKWQNGAFTYAIKEGLANGKADSDGNGIVTINELYTFVSAKVPSIVTEVKGKSQHPTMPVNEMLGKVPVFVIQK